MEAIMDWIMDWRLIYRTRADMHTLAAALPQDQLTGYELFDNGYEAITYLAVFKN
jgi:hypothetical protein